MYLRAQYVGMQKDGFDKVVHIFKNDLQSSGSGPGGTQWEGPTPKSIESVIEDRAFLRVYDSAPRPRPPLSWANFLWNGRTLCPVLKKQIIIYEYFSNIFYYLSSSSGAIGQRIVLIDRVWVMRWLWVRASPGADSFLQNLWFMMTSHFPLIIK